MNSAQQRNLILQLAGYTLIGMPIVAWIMDIFSDSFNIGERLRMGAPWYLQILMGAAAGFVIGGIAQWLVNRPFLSEVNIRYSSLLNELQLDRNQIIFISLCAGVGEEILFRGALQPILMNWLGNHQGVWITAFVFVAIHGYLNPKDWRLSVYGVFMTVAIAGLGYATEFYGLWIAIIAHTLIDIYLLRKIHSVPES